MDEKLTDNDVPLNRQSGWLNWLSLGMLGAGGTENSSQFSGVISDAVVKVIIIFEFCYKKFVSLEIYVLWL